MLGDVILVSVVGGLISLDRAAAFQIMVSRPIVAGPVIGFLLGQPGVGIIIGGMAELLWSHQPPLGGFLAPDPGLGAMIVTAGVSLVMPEDASAFRPLIVLGFLLLPPLARLASGLEIIKRRRNELLLQKAESAVSAGNLKAPHRLNILALGQGLLVTAAFMIVFVPLAAGLTHTAYAMLPLTAVHGLETAFFFLPLAGIASALGATRVRYSGLAYGLLLTATMLLMSW